MIKVGIAGGAGYTAGELVRLLINHPRSEISYIHSTSQAGSAVTDIHRDLIGEITQKFTGRINLDIDILFLCLEHGKAQLFLDEYDIPPQVKIIDLSQDFRIHSSPQRKFIYGLPEKNRDQIKVAGSIANPGCFATAIQLALLPLAAEHKLVPEIHINGITGSTGAGFAPSAKTHYSWRFANTTLYKPFQHQHLAEIDTTLKEMQPEWKGTVNFLPYRGPFTRGIFTAVYCHSDLTATEIRELYRNYYAEHPFIHISEDMPDMKQVVNTNKAVLHPSKHGDIILVASIIDNLIKGAAGQAVQNMNLMSGIDECTGLRLKPAAY